MSIGATLFPAANREAAGVAFIRTAWQTFRATGLLAGGGGLFVTAAQLAHLDLANLGLAAGAVVASSLLAGGIAGGDILVHGLPDAYTSAPAPVVAPVPVEPPAPVA